MESTNTEAFNSNNVDASLTPKDLVEFLSSKFQRQHVVRDTSNYRYVIYARKSTENAEKQVRSLSDQVIECKQLAERENLKVLSVIMESESAKEPDIRPKFRQMLEDMKSGKFECVISWHPDRLARNMKDAGEVIDLLDKELIKDLRFVSYTFVNDTAGKMMLGISFVLSKQYSDKLSDDVLRGNKRSIEEGKYLGRVKHGYYKDANQLLRPDGDNFLLIKQAFQLRLQGKTIDQIVDFLHSNNYSSRQPNGQHKIYRIDKKRVSDFLKDPAYTGVLIRGDNIVDLTEKYQFVPALSVEEFLKINKLTLSKAFRLAKKFYPPQTIKADLFRGLVTCGQCNEIMSSGITTKPKVGKSYFYFRCETESCPVKNKSVRAKVIVDSACEYLEEHQITGTKAYEHYKKETAKVFAERLADVKKQYDSLLASRREAENKLSKIKDFLIKEDSAELRDSFKADLALKETELKELAEQISKLKTALDTKKTAILTYPQFLELSSKLPVVIRKTKHMEDLDFLIRKIFSNFIIINKKTAQIKLNEPFNAILSEAEMPKSLQWRDVVEDVRTVIRLSKSYISVPSLV